MHYRSLMIAAILVLAGFRVSAHALWIETSPTGKKGQPQEVRVFWGEFGDKDISPLDKWFSDTKAYTLSVITPDKIVIPLTSTPGKDHYKAFFTPESDGVYTVVMIHAVKDVYHGSRLDYHSSAAVLVGNTPGDGAGKTNANPLKVETAARAKYKVNERIKLGVQADQAPAGSSEVEVIAPNGWIKKLYTDSTGTAAFTPLWPGRYMVEVAKTEKKGGDHHGKPFEAIWRCATYCIEVTEK
ncbi:hypothetical protein EGT74_04150 [Chitinophaga lutea]|uniref:DUF4198 domain-containing protein n=1 Tax=Chitinophaga lutea TaxID=2488634 RepID=A0A3N4PZB3_9BACT|nr:hypothetical protein [Chitinophaga lutea]RPE12745.1 hypothetical protein EGT74_04150 [Chitinophaga lutea]